MKSTIRDPEFIDVAKTKVRFKLIDENGAESVAELAVPPKMARGVNPYWDRILDEFDVDKMRRDRNTKEQRLIKQREFEDKKRKAGIENEKLKALFNAKMQAFEMPFINDAPDKVKSAIRRAPNLMLLNAVIQEQMLQFMKEKDMSFIDLFDYLDDEADKKEAEIKNSKK